MIDHSRLRLSAQRALLGRIHPEMRLVKIRAVGPTIILSVIVENAVSDRVREDVSDATTEIIADFPDATKIEERFEIGDGQIPTQNILSEGWVFRRAD
jgi:hypothetical protein